MESSRTEAENTAANPTEGDDPHEGPIPHEKVTHPRPAPCEASFDPLSSDEFLGAHTACKEMQSHSMRRRSDVRQACGAFRYVLLRQQGYMQKHPPSDVCVCA